MSKRYLSNNGIAVLKFFLNVSKDEQKRRFLARIEQPEKNWKFSLADVKERRCWDDYMAAYEDMVNHTSTDCAPWYIVPADHKWHTSLVVARIIVSQMKALHLSYPTLNQDQEHELQEAKQVLASES